jgi:hypothetical protein
MTTEQITPEEAQAELTAAYRNRDTVNTDYRNEREVVEGMQETAKKAADDMFACGIADCKARRDIALKDANAAIAKAAAVKAKISRAQAKAEARAAAESPKE